MYSRDRVPIAAILMELYVHNGIESLGYSLMDEASGNYFGKRLIRDYFYKKMPSQLSQEFENKI